MASSSRLAPRLVKGSVWPKVSLCFDAERLSAPSRSSPVISSTSLLTFPIACLASSSARLARCSFASSSSPFSNSPGSAMAYSTWTLRGKMVLRTSSCTSASLTWMPARFASWYCASSAPPWS